MHLMSTLITYYGVRLINQSPWALTSWSAGCLQAYSDDYSYNQIISPPRFVLNQQQYINIYYLQQHNESICMNATLQVLCDSNQKLPCVPTLHKFTSREVHRHIATILRPGHPGLILSNSGAGVYVRESGPEIWTSICAGSHHLICMNI